MTLPSILKNWKKILVRFLHKLWVIIYASSVLAAEIDKNAAIESEKKEKTKAIRELEAMVKQLRKDKEDLKIKSSEFESTAAKLKETEELAEKRKITSDNLAKEVC